MEGQELRDKFWSVYRDIERLLGAGRKAEALDAVCGAFKLYTDAPASGDMVFIGGVIDLQHLLASYAPADARESNGQNDLSNSDDGL